MSKQLAPLNSFDGGLNTSTNERDIADNEFIAGKNVDSSVVGRLKSRRRPYSPPLLAAYFRLFCKLEFPLKSPLPGAAISRGCASASIHPGSVQILSEMHVNLHISWTDPLNSA